MAGFLQAYLWRYLGMDFTQVQGLIQPYLLARVAGGVLYTAGGILVAWRLIKAWWLTREDGKIDAEVPKRV